MSVMAPALAPRSAVAVNVAGAAVGAGATGVVFADAGESALLPAAFVAETV